MSKQVTKGFPSSDNPDPDGWMLTTLSGFIVADVAENQSWVLLGALGVAFEAVACPFIFVMTRQHTENRHTVQVTPLVGMWAPERLCAKTEGVSWICILAILCKEWSASQRPGANTGGRHGNQITRHRSKARTSSEAELKVAYVCVCVHK